VFEGNLKILFEPWNLGDAIIAASVAKSDPDRFTLACNSKWHEVLTLASNGSLKLIGLDLPYVWRTDKNFFSLGEAASIRTRFTTEQRHQIEVINIRGDVRDLVAAHRIFKGAAFNFSGWLPFCARKSSFFDLPFRLGLLKVRNRYHAWAEAAHIPFNIVERPYDAHPEKQADAPVVIHIGAQWRSKQYPQVAGLAVLLRDAGKRVIILAGPDDPLPPGVDPKDVQRPKWPELVSHLRNARIIITNDSGPMHLAAYLGSKTLVLSRCANILEWLPPGTMAISSPSAPKGYRPIPDYWTDHILNEWPSPEEVTARYDDWF
jgi:hypothetical protein